MLTGDWFGHGAHVRVMGTEKAGIIACRFVTLKDEWGYVVEFPDGELEVVNPSQLDAA
jgi:hypothetical protein